MNNSFYTVLSSLENSALLAFNIQNIYHLNALYQLSYEGKIPIIAQLSVKYADLFEKLYSLDCIIERYKTSHLFFHLDHCKDFNLIEKCINVGFDGVMYDGSDLALDENIRNTLEIKKMIKSSNCLLEGEVGRIGGKEDGVIGNNNLVDVDDAVTYYRATHVDLLALGIGNIHGFYSENIQVDVSILNEFNKKLGKAVFLVLHGTSGLSIEIVHQAIKNGARKINFSTDLKMAATEFNKSYFTSEKLFEEINYMGSYTDFLKKFYSEHINQYSK